MTELESKAILHQIQLGRVQNGLVRDCLKQLENANKLIQSELRKTKGIYTKARYKEIRQYLKDVAKELKKNINSSMTVSEFIDYELKAQERLYKKYAGVQLVAPPKEQLVTTALFTPYTTSSTFENYLNSFEYDFFNVWDSNVRTGFLTGLPTEKVVRNVMGYPARDSSVADYGAIHSLRQSVERNTRTALQSFAMETHRMVYEQNEELFNGYKWLATLDRRTCILCGQMENKVFHSIKEINMPPLHYNCRCSVVPLVKGLDELDAGSTRASMNGQVDSKITFEEWLKEQSESIQKDVLGETRYEMFKEGKPMKDFVADNRILRISEITD